MLLQKMPPPDQHIIISKFACDFVNCLFTLYLLLHEAHTLLNVFFGTYLKIKKKNSFSSIICECIAIGMFICSLFWGGCVSCCLCCAPNWATLLVIYLWMGDLWAWPKSELQPSAVDWHWWLNIRYQSIMCIIVVCE